MELTYDNLLIVLTEASGCEINLQQRNAEGQLKNWEIVPGFHFLLQEVYLKTDLALQIRWLAIICFKNGVDKYWRPARENAISKQEKAQIKARCFKLLGEQNNQLVIQNAHSISKIARYDFPTDWPLLFDEIAQLLEQYVFKSNDLISTNNLLTILNRIVKTISMVRIGRSRHALTLKAPLVITVLVKIYIKSFQTWISNMDLRLMEICYLSLKTLRRIIPECFEQLHQNVEVTEFLNLSIEHLQIISAQYDEKFASCDLLERYVKQYSKLYVNLLTNHATNFVLMPCCSKIITTFLTILEQKAEVVYNSSEGEDEGNSNFWETLAIKGFIILKKVIGYVYKKGAMTLKPKNDKLEIENAINKLNNEIFTPSVILHLCDLIITWYLRLRPSDLESWSMESEEWANEELAQSWEFQIRPCAENFYQDLIKYFPDTLNEFVMKKISNGFSADEILIKDSILCTFQLSSSAIGSNIKFESILADVLIPEALKNDVIENKILKRRICLIINEWISAESSPQGRVNIYKLLINLLQPDNPINDLVVKISAVHTLKVVVEDWDFQKKEFIPFLNEFVKLLLHLLGNLSLVESKLFLFTTLASVIDKCNPLIDQQTLLDILQIIPTYWEISNSEPILKNSLMRVLKSLIVSLNENSVATHAISLPLIRSCCTETSEFYTLLSEDGYDIWLALLVYCPNNVPKDDILSLFELLPSALKNSTEILPTLISILRSYTLLAPELFNQPGQAVEEIFQVIGKYLPTMRDDAFGILVTVLDILFLTNSRSEAFISALLNSGFFSAIFQYILDDKQSIPQANKLLLVLSRFARVSPDIYISIMSHLNLDQTQFIALWLEYYGKNGNPRNKKINLLGITSVLSKSYGSFPQLFNQALKLTFYFLEEVSESNEGSCEAYKHDFTYDDIDDYSYLDSDIKPHGEKLRYGNLLDNYDPVYKVNLQEHLKSILLDIKSNSSDNDFKQLLGANEQYIIDKLEVLLA